MTIYYIASHNREILDGPFSSAEEAAEKWRDRVNNRHLQQGSVYKRSQLARGVAAAWDEEKSLDEYYEDRAL